MGPLKIHPITLKKILQGHPWITDDQYSRKFPAQERILQIRNENTGKIIGHFLHDPKHPRVKARFWSKDIGNFKEQLLERLNKSYKKRNLSKLNRENYYVSFGEADELPGLFIQKLGSTVLIQYQAYFWGDHLETIKGWCLNEFPELESLWTQLRVPGQQKICPVHFWGNKKDHYDIQEDKIKLRIEYQSGHDIGLYTDMASIRQKVMPLISKSNHILNLFSYTGAFSLLGLAYNKKVTSVDLSRSYMNRLNTNILLNNFEEKLHCSKIGSCAKVLEKLQESDEKYDLVICDPPSFSSDGKKKTSSTQFYKDQFKKIYSLTQKDGAILLFINTHKLTKQKFKAQIDPLLRQMKAKIIAEYGLSQDCPTMNNFPEGDYLKGILIRRY